jgi:hypothetical protein
VATAPHDPKLVDHIVESIVTRILYGALSIVAPPVGLVALLLYRPHSDGERRFRRQWLWIAGTLTALIALAVIWLALQTLGSSGPRHA